MVLTTNACSAKTVVEVHPLLPALTHVGLIETGITIPRDEEDVLDRTPTAEDWKLSQASDESLGLGQLLVRACFCHVSRNGNKDGTARIVERDVLLQFVERVG